MNCNEKSVKKTKNKKTENVLVITTPLEMGHLSWKV